MDKHFENKDRIYEKLQGVYQLDPNKFEQIREELIRQALDEMPEELRARAYGMQRQIDHQLKRYRDPVARMNAMVEIFWRQVYEFQAVLNNPRGVLESRRRQGASAKILPFRNPGTRH